ncbi:hypothetical protein [Flavobacterium alkalisoli]|uniref:hypothetical protein n=1 Tax=Flavobacterium alkalisoli TaxID=2602769 RepID=UPI003A904659
MKSNIKKIYLNAQRSLYTDINGKVNKLNFQYIFVKILIPICSVCIVYLNREKLIEDPKIIGTLLSLFSGLMFGVLIKIPDKFKDIEGKENQTNQDKFKRLQIKNYLKLFMFSLSYSILVALFSIFFVVTSSFYPLLINQNLNQYHLISNFKEIELANTFTFLVIIVFRFLLISFILNFLFFILKAVSNLYEFMLYEFNKLK